VDDLELRHRIYGRLAATGRAPSVAEVGELVGGPAEAAHRLRRLHDAHMIVLDEDGEIRMALPFSARPSEHVVVSGEQRWWANCAWDSLAIPAALGCDAAVEAVWLETGEPVDIAVRGGELEGPDGFVHFVVPAGHWWDDIVET
jgi:hypothetical protein